MFRRILLKSKREIAVLLLATVLLAVCICWREIPYSLEDKLKIPGDIACVIVCYAYDIPVTISEYIGRYVLPYEKGAILQVKCKDVKHYLMPNAAGVNCVTINTVEITDVYQGFNKADYQKGQILQLRQLYGFYPYIGEEDATDLLLKLQYGISMDSACKNKSGHLFEVDLKDGFSHHLHTFENILPLDEGEYYFILVSGNWCCSSLELAIPCDLDQYQDFMDNKYKAVRFNSDYRKVLQSFRDIFIFPENA